MTSRPADWNASAYDRVADPQARWGAAVLERLPLDGDETVLDAGCGTGRVTELLIGRLPRGHVVALDASGSMLAEARGWLVAQCGGAGNVETMLQVARSIAPDFSREHRFETAETTRDRLEASGFTDVQTWLSKEPTRFEPGEPFEAFLETVCLRTYLDGLPEDRRKPLVEAVAAGMGERVPDYVRLNIVSRRSTEA
jgi:trans-aconitate 2-methyltransferase